MFRSLFDRYCIEEIEKKEKEIICFTRIQIKFYSVPNTQTKDLAAIPTCSLYQNNTVRIK
jgi:hypothetical protein